MLRIALLSLILFISLSSSSILRKSISRRQSEIQSCEAIEGFDCRCSYYRATCTTTRAPSSPITINPHEANKYQSVELVIAAPEDISVNDHTFEPIKQLYKSEGDNFDFRVKFEKFTALHLTSPGIFNRVFPNNLPSHARKHLALEIYNPDVPPSDNPNLFQNLNADTLELYALYPFHGSFQQLFDGANIKYVRLSGGDIRSDLSQQFTGNIGRLELAKQANALTVQNFPIYPAHEYIINAFYISEFDAEHAPNYDNVGEVRIHSLERIPANAFRQFSNIHTLSISTEKDIDVNALNGLNKLEKLTVKDTKPSLELLNGVPNLKEFETSVEKLDEKSQCQLIEKLAGGQVAVQSIPNGRECTCVAAYLDTAAGRSACDAEHCEHSSCAAIKSNYDESTRTFKSPPVIQRADGTNALHQREQQGYSAPYQVLQQDQQKYQAGAPQTAPSAHSGDSSNPSGDNQGQWPSETQNSQGGSDQNNQQTDGDNNQPDGDGNENQSTGDGNNNQSGDGDNAGNQGDGQGNENQSSGDGSADSNGKTATDSAEGDSDAAPPKKKWSWLPIIIIVAAIVGIILILLIILYVRKRSKKSYSQAPTKESGGAVQS